MRDGELKSKCCCGNGRCEPTHDVWCFVCMWAFERFATVSLCPICQVLRYVADPSGRSFSSLLIAVAMRLVRSGSTRSFFETVQLQETPELSRAPSEPGGNRCPDLGNRRFTRRTQHHEPRTSTRHATCSLASDPTLLGPSRRCFERKENCTRCDQNDH